jgi:hypothetical protein
MSGRGVQGEMMIALILYTGIVFLIGYLLGAWKVHKMICDCAEHHKLFIDKHEIINKKENNGCENA